MNRHIALQALLERVADLEGQLDQIGADRHQQAVGGQPVGPGVSRATAPQLVLGTRTVVSAAERDEAVGAQQRWSRQHPGEEFQGLRRGGGDQGAHPVAVAERLDHRGLGLLAVAPVGEVEPGRDPVHLRGVEGARHQRRQRSAEADGLGQVPVHEGRQGHLVPGRREHQHQRAELGQGPLGGLPQVRVSLGERVQQRTGRDGPGGGLERVPVRVHQQRAVDAGGLPDGCAQQLQPRGGEPGDGLGDGAVVQQPVRQLAEVLRQRAPRQRRRGQ